MRVVGDEDGEERLALLSTLSALGRQARGNRPDTVRPLGIKGMGEISGVGVSAAIANAVYHATGRRILANHRRTFVVKP
jgi:hypothetical protein